MNNSFMVKRSKTSIGRKSVFSQARSSMKRGISDSSKLKNATLGWAKKVQDGEPELDKKISMVSINSNSSKSRSSLKDKSKLPLKDKAPSKLRFDFMKRKYASQYID